MSNAGQRIVRFCLKRAGAEPLQKRARLYRDLAEFSPSVRERRRLLALADECRAVERRHRQLVLDCQEAAR